MFAVSGPPLRRPTALGPTSTAQNLPVFSPLTSPTSPSGKPCPRRGDRRGLLSQTVDPGYPSNRLTGGARLLANRTGSTDRVFSVRWVRIFSSTTGSTMQAMIRTSSPQARRVSMSIVKTRFRRCAQVIEARHSAGVGSSGSSVAARRPPLPRFAGVTRTRCLLFGANTP